jgi:hypothetical protein
MRRVKTFSSALTQSVSPLSVRSLTMFRKVTEFYCGHKKKDVDKFSANIAAVCNVKSRSRYINHKTSNGYVAERYQFIYTSI